MIHHIGVTPEIMASIDHNDTMTPTYLVWATSKTYSGQLIASRETNHDAQANSETTRDSFWPLMLTMPDLGLKIDVRGAVKDIIVLTHSYAKRHILYMSARRSLIDSTITTYKKRY